jgi:hypothetical protein
LKFTADIGRKYAFKSEKAPLALRKMGFSYSSTDGNEIKS